MNNYFKPNDLLAPVRYKKNIKKQMSCVPLYTKKIEIVNKEN